MWKMLASVAILIPASAAAQAITSYTTDRPALLKGDSNKIVCKSEETIGTRLGAKKVCLTVAEWNNLQREQRERTERIQSSVCELGEGQPCLDPY